MDFIDRLSSAVAGILFGALVALALTFSHFSVGGISTFKICMAVGGVGGFVLGQSFLDLLSGLSSFIWRR